MRGRATSLADPVHRWLFEFRLETRSEKCAPIFTRLDGGFSLRNGIYGRCELIKHVSHGCCWKVVRFPVTLSTTCILPFSFTELKKLLFLSGKCCTFSTIICFWLKRNLNIERRGDFESQLTNVDVLDIWQTGRSRVLRKISEGQ